MRARTGVLLVNLGTPDAPETAAVRRYLGEFLADPRVVDINPVGRWALLTFIILPRRSPKSAEAYEKIWTHEGSPLLAHSRALTAAVADKLPDHPVELAMRYGTPSLEAGLAALRAAGCERIVVLPLYPQYASSTTGSTLQAVYAEAGKGLTTPFLVAVPPFFDDARFIGAFAAVGKPVLDEVEPDHVLMSFHGLPERHLRNGDPSGNHCLAKDDCCASVGEVNRSCYRAQCFATARALAKALDLPDDGYTVSFQSRLGRDPWIRPYTDEVLGTLREKGVKRVAVFCPAFVADCLETLEEIGMAAVESFKAAGGELHLVPSLNAHPSWVDAVVGLLREHL